MSATFPPGEWIPGLLQGPHSQHEGPWAYRSPRSRRSHQVGAGPEAWGLSPSPCLPLQQQHLGLHHRRVEAAGSDLRDRSRLTLTIIITMLSTLTTTTSTTNNCITKRRNTHYRQGTSRATHSHARVWPGYSFRLKRFSCFHFTTTHTLLLSLSPLHLLLLLQLLLASHFLTATAYRSRWSPRGHHCGLEATIFQVPSHECQGPALATHQIEGPGAQGVLRLDLAHGLLGPHTRCECGSVGPVAGHRNTVHLAAVRPEK